MMLSFLAKLGELISKISNPLLPVFNKSKYEHIRAYTAGNINIDRFYFSVSSCSSCHFENTSKK